MEYVICTDASCDLQLDVKEKNNVEFVPMEYSIGEEMRTSYGCEEDDILKKFYDGQRNGDLTKTTQITPYMYQSYFEKFLEEGKSVLYLCLSSGLSSTFNSACLAAQNLKDEYPDLDVFPIDSLSATGGMGVLVERAISNLNKGMTIEENRDDLENAKHDTKTWFLVDDLNYLKRGGRVSAATAFLGSMLNVKPLLRILPNGKLDTIMKKRGSRPAMLALFEIFKKSYDKEKGNVVYICDADNNSLADELTALVKEFDSNIIIRRTMLSPIIGAHTGPNMLAICHLGNEIEF